MQLQLQKMLDLAAFAAVSLLNHILFMKKHNHPGKSSSSIIKIVAVIKNYDEDVKFRLKGIQDKDHYILFYQVTNQYL